MHRRKIGSAACLGIVLLANGGNAQFSAEAAAEITSEEDTDAERETAAISSIEPRAAEPPPPDPTWLGIWSLYGTSLAVVDEGSGRGIAIGVELSDVHVFRRQLWYGYYADLRYSQLASGVDLSVGVEGGISVIGFDVGLYGRLGRRSAIGIRARGCLSALAVVSFCAGGGITRRDRFFEGTLLLKYGRRRDE